MTSLQERKRDLLRFGTVIDLKDYEDETGAKRFYTIKDARGQKFQIYMHNGDVLSIEKIKDST